MYAVRDMDGNLITADARGFVIGDRAGFNARVVDTAPEGHPDYVLADLTDPAGEVTFYASVLVPTAKLRLDKEVAS